MKEPFASNGSRRRLVQQLRYSQSDWTSFWGLHTRYILRSGDYEQSCGVSVTFAGG
jgi:hypothetical protein